MALKFNNPKTGEQYEALTEFDQRLEVPATAECGCQNYSGMLSDITPCAAKRYVESKGNLIRKKEVAPGPGPAPVIETKKSEPEKK